MGSRDRRYRNVLKSNQNQLTQNVSLLNLSAYVCVCVCILELNGYLLDTAVASVFFLLDCQLTISLFATRDGQKLTMAR